MYILCYRIFVHPVSGTPGMRCDKYIVHRVTPYPGQYTFSHNFGMESRIKKIKRSLESALEWLSNDVLISEITTSHLPWDASTWPGTVSRLQKSFIVFYKLVFVVLIALHHREVSFSMCIIDSMKAWWVAPEV